MTKPGSRITVAKSIVTGIRIESGVLRVDGVDQDRHGNTLASHQLEFDPDAQGAKVPAGVATAIDTLEKFAQDKVEEA